MPSLFTSFPLSQQVFLASRPPIVPVGMPGDPCAYATIPTDPCVGADRVAAVPTAQVAGAPIEPCVGADLIAVLPVAADNLPVDVQEQGVNEAFVASLPTSAFEAAVLDQAPLMQTRSLLATLGDPAQNSAPPPFDPSRSIISQLLNPSQPSDPQAGPPFDPSRSIIGQLFPSQPPGIFRHLAELLAPPLRVVEAEKLE